MASNRYFLSGGPERYLFAIEKALVAAGHTIIPFALNYRRNLQTDAAQYFPSPPVDDDFVLYGNRRLALHERVRLAGRVIHDRDVYRSALHVLREERIEAVYALQIAHYLYPDLLLAARDAGVPTVMRLSDFQMICPAYNCLRAGKPCFLCRDSLVPALVHRCLKRSLSVTAARVAAMVYARKRGVPKSVAAYISPSRFLVEKMLEAGFSATNVFHLPTPVELPPDPGPPPEDGPLLFVGGLYEAKGARVAIDAVRGTGHKLIVAGGTDTPEGRSLQEYVIRERIVEVSFVGFVEGEQLVALYRQARTVVVPSLWWENSPHTVLEAMAYARPVLASDLGSLPEAVREGETGMLFRPGDALALRERIAELDQARLAERLGNAGRDWVAKEHSPIVHLERLQAILEGALR